MSVSSTDKSPPRPDKPIAPHRMTVGRSMVVWCAALAVAAVVAVSLLVSVGAIREKAKMVRGTSQILDLVDMSRHLAEFEHSLGTTSREDLLMRLAHMQQIKVASEDGALATVTNPWGGTLVAYTVPPDSRVKMETVVPSRACARIITLLTENIKALGLRQIEARGINEGWRQIYSGEGRARLGKNQINAGCHGDDHIILALTFNLR